MVELHFMDPDVSATATLHAAKMCASRNPGGHQVVVRLGQRRLTLGDAWRAAGTPEAVHAFKLALPTANVSVL